MSTLGEAGPVETRLVKILKESLPRSARNRVLTRETGLRDVGIDSLALALLVARFAETFEIELAELGDALPQPSTVGELLVLGQAVVDEWAQRKTVTQTGVEQ